MVQNENRWLLSPSLRRLKALVWSYYRENARPMPWRKNRTPYRVFVSEIMLQQTGISRVGAKYPEFLARFPTFAALADASLHDVLSLWKGLGYNRRALALHESSRIIVEKFRGRMPRTVEELMTLPGVGHATASAVLVYSFNTPLAFIETNVRRVFLHFLFPGETGIKDAQLLPLVEKAVDTDNPREWYYALMDYGTMLARITENPNRRSAHYTRQSAFNGSHRQLRGKILEVMLALREATEAQIVRAVEKGTGKRDQRLPVALRELVAEGFLKRVAGRYFFK